MGEQLKALDISELDSFLNQVDSGLREYLPGVSLAEILRKPGSLPWYDPFDLATRILSTFFREIRANAGLLGQLICLAVLANFLTSAITGFGYEGTSRIAQWVSFLVLAVIGLSSFRIAIGIARDAITGMTSLMYVLLPSMFSILSAVGGITQVAILSPILLAAVNAVAHITGAVTFPAIFLAGLFDVLGTTSDRVQVSRLAGLFKEAAIIVLGLSFALFLGVVTIRGAGAAVVDNVAVRSAKFLTGTFVPVVGKMFSDAVGVAAGCSLLIQSSLRLVGLLGVLAICLDPVLKILAIVTMYRLASALVQPLGDEKISMCLAMLAGGLSLVAVVVGVVALMFFTTIGMLAGLGSATAAAR
ncbi:MAG TPA: stage III sporulation protein AE [Firmicutes bacterium]|nr:stage III sporulation protein AE [Bacillota bacterium]